MLYIRGQTPDARHDWSRRDLLRVGLAAGCGLAGGLPLVGRPHRAGSRSRRRRSGFGRAKSLVLVYLFGGPSHIDMWDMKPAARAAFAASFSRLPRMCRGSRSRSTCRGWRGRLTSTRSSAR